MKGLPPELIYVLVIGAVLLFNYVTQQVARRQKIEEQPPADAPPTTAEPSLDEDFPQPRARPPMRPAPAPQAATAVAPAPEYETLGAPSRLRGSRFTRASLLGSRRDVQRAVVAAAILGPCRAFEPHEVR